MRKIMHVFHSVLLFLVFLAHPGGGQCGSVPQTGDLLPEFELVTPAGKADQEYLGVSGETFHLRDIDARVILVEVIGVYCPYCYEQAPLFRNLYNRIQDGKLAGKVKMVGIAAGGTPMEADYLRQEGQYDYPLVQDPKYEVHKFLGEPRTPFTMIIDKEGKVLYAHAGIIKDIDTLYGSIDKFVE
jgi:peroxiredoxin